MVSLTPSAQKPLQEVEIAAVTHGALQGLAYHYNRILRASAALVMAGRELVFCVPPHSLCWAVVFLWPKPLPSLLRCMSYPFAFPSAGM